MGVHEHGPGEAQVARGAASPLALAAAPAYAGA
jgi:hypothetical protein